MEITDLITGEIGASCINVRGTNGSGKTTIMRTLIASDSDSTEIHVRGLRKAAFTYVPSYNILILGSYKNVCGGCDNFVKAQIVRLLKIAWATKADILYEGVMLHTTVPYHLYMRELSETIAYRLFGYAYLELPIEECLKRVYIRNGGKQINEKYVLVKRQQCLHARAWQKEQPDGIVLSLDAMKQPQEVLSRLLAITTALKKVTV